MPQLFRARTVYGRYGVVESICSGLYSGISSARWPEIDFVEYHKRGPLQQVGLETGQLIAEDLIISLQLCSGDVQEEKQNPGSLDVLQKLNAQTFTLMSSQDESGNVS